MTFSIQQAMEEFFGATGNTSNNKDVYWGVSLNAGPITSTPSQGSAPVLDVSAIDLANPLWIDVSGGSPQSDTLGGGSQGDTLGGGSIVYDSSTGGGTDQWSGTVLHNGVQVPWNETFSGETWPGGPLHDPSWVRENWDLDLSLDYPTNDPHFFFDQPHWFEDNTPVTVPGPVNGNGQIFEKGYLFLPTSWTSAVILATTLGTVGNDSMQGSGLLLGGDGDDTLTGSDGVDFLVAGTGNNMLEGGKGADHLDGTGGWSVADYRHAATAVTVNLD